MDKITGALHIKKHEADQKVHKEDTKADATTATTSKTPIFDNSKVTVIFVLGGPGAGERCVI